MSEVFDVPMSQPVVFRPIPAETDPGVADTSPLASVTR